MLRAGRAPSPLRVSAVLALVLGACGAPPSSEHEVAPRAEPPAEPAASAAAVQPEPAVAVSPAQPAAAPSEPPLPPEPTTPIACHALGASIGIYEGSRTGDALVLTARIAGDEDEMASRFPVRFSLEPVDLDGDGTEDAIATFRYADGEPECGNWGECVTAVLVRCDRGWAMVMGPGYVLGLSAGATRTEHAGRRWRVILAENRSGDMEEEAEGRGAWTTVLALGERGYGGTTRAPWFESERCAAFYREGRLMRAHDMCEQGLSAHPRGRVRGALYYDLGRIAEAEGRSDDARDTYRRSLEARPGDVTVQARLDALAE